MKITVDLTVCQGYARRVPGPGRVPYLWRGGVPVRTAAKGPAAGAGAAGGGRLSGAGHGRRNGAAISVSSLKRIVIVGASLAGLRGAEALRREGFRER